ncbi:MAG: 1-acyl-sn-glycerol-3-phosphate acyltransferase [Planctomycetes bacterium]|nr:1-acyl-sn-glycerol-3-phosphate acyltransferase [Planctomycetota bacterium]
MEPWQYDTADDLDQTPIERLRKFPRRPEMFVFGLRLGAAALIRLWLRLYHRLTVVGAENLPPSGSFVIAANHASHLDALSIVSALPIGKVHRVFPAAAKDYFFVSLPRLALAAIVINALPFDRRRSIRRSLTLCHDLLAQSDNVLVLFPEGTRSAAGEIGPFKPGIGLLLAGTPHPAVPCYLAGTHDAWPKGAWLPRPKKVRVTFGRPLVFSDRERGKQAAVQIADQLRQAILALAESRREADNKGKRSGPLQ